MLPRVEHRQTVLIPHADHIVEVFVTGQRLGRAFETLIAQRQGNLLQMVVEQFPRLVMRGPVGCPAAQ